MGALVRIRWRTRKYKGRVTKVREAVWNNPETGERCTKAVEPNTREAARALSAKITKELERGVKLSRRGTSMPN